MKEVLDRTKSKHPTKVPDRKDYQKIHQEMQAVTDNMMDAKELAEALENNTEYQGVVALSYARLIQLMKNSLEVEFTKETMLQHAELRGMFRERLRLTKELQGVRRFETIGERIKKRLKGILDGMGKRDPEQE